MSRFILVTKEIYPLLFQGFHQGSWTLSSDNPSNDRRDKREGKNGGEIARNERALLRALKSIGNEEELSDDELVEFGKQFFKETGAAPTIKDIEKLGKVIRLKEDPCWLELNEELWERFVSYFREVKWSSGNATLAANVLDMIEIAPKEKPMELENV